MVAFFRRKVRPVSVLDIPPSQYDQKTQLPHEIRIGEEVYSPFVAVEDLQAHLVVLAAFHAFRTSATSFSRACEQAAYQYQLWAQVVLPRRARQRKARKEAEKRRLEAAQRQDLPSPDSYTGHGTRSTNTTDSESGPPTTPVLRDVTAAGPSIASPSSLDGDAARGEVNTNGKAKGRVMFHDEPVSMAGDAASRSSSTCSPTSNHGSTSYSPSSATTAASVDIEDQLPPIGVLMCWHAHLLAPRIFERETRGAYAALRNKPFPLPEVAAAITSNTLPTDLIVSGSESRQSLQSTVWDPLDVAAAVQRQAVFIENMHKIGWLVEGKFSEQVVDLQRGIVRYHAFLDLLRAHSLRHFLVPTLDIDLAWHTHLLDPRAYKHDTMAALATDEMLDHRDNVGEGRVGDGLKVTGKLWKERFGREYQY